jgi:hypothetical protein
VRILVQFTFPTTIGNEVIRSGKIKKFFDQIAADLKPEAMYFFPVDGDRAGLMVINTDNPSICASVGERFWFGIQAKVKVTPCMNGEDLGKGLAEMPKILENYG